MDHRIRIKKRRQLSDETIKEIIAPAPIHFCILVDLRTNPKRQCARGIIICNTDFFFYFIFSVCRLRKDRQTSIVIFKTGIYNLKIITN